MLDKIYRRERKIRIKILYYYSYLKMFANVSLVTT